MYPFWTRATWVRQVAGSATLYAADLRSLIDSNSRAIAFDNQVELIWWLENAQ
jgi:hypothetical protein